MNKIHDTTSVCEHCYRHIPAVLFERDGSIWLSKKCKWHGDSEHLVEPNADFYINYKYDRPTNKTYCLDITNRCNLNCPHCYQIPDNMSKDPSIEEILNIINAWEDDGYAIALMGAEPTTRKDLPELCRAIQALPGKPRGIMILTNGVYLSDLEYTKQFEDMTNVFWTIGLNHPDYQGHTVRKKQMEGIANCMALGMPIKNVSYTLETIDQLEYCLEEIQEFGKTLSPHNYRIRVGTDIGRHPGEEKVYLSELVGMVMAICDKKGWEYKYEPSYGIRVHYPLRINGILVKIIQWPDVRTLDLEEDQTESWSDIIPGKPVSPLVHQVILRDGAVNKNLPLYDTVPEKYQRKYDARD
jgi:MoaA/NifB/PqqE/SkfB family radical SAM enzyme